MKNKLIAVPTQEISEIVQKKLLELGYEWYLDEIAVIKRPNIKYTFNTYICIKENKYLKYGYRRYYFEECKGEFEEITMYDLYQMKPVKDTVTLTTEDGKKLEISRESLEALKKLK